MKRRRETTTTEKGRESARVRSLLNSYRSSAKSCAVSVKGGKNLLHPELGAEDPIIYPYSLGKRSMFSQNVTVG